MKICGRSCFWITAITLPIDSLIARMQAYSTAIKAKDADTLRELLREGREKCIAIDEIKDFD